MKIDRPEHYYKVSLERTRQAGILYEEGASFALGMYIHLLTKLSRGRPSDRSCQ